MFFSAGRLRGGALRPRVESSRASGVRRRATEAPRPAENSDGLAGLGLKKRFSLLVWFCVVLDGFWFCAVLDGLVSLLGCQLCASNVGACVGLRVCARAFVCVLGGHHFACLNSCWWVAEFVWPPAAFNCQPFLHVSCKSTFSEGRIVRLRFALRHPRTRKHWPHLPWLYLHQPLAETCLSQTVQANFF